jgi:hypothetical protein
MSDENGGTITVDPNPTTQGGRVTICYGGFGGNSEIILSVQFDLEGGGLTGQSVVLTPFQNCVTLVVPDNASGGLVQDTTGTADDVAITVTPP